MSKPNWILLTLFLFIPFSGFSEDRTLVRFEFYPKTADGWNTNYSLELYSLESQKPLGTLKYRDGPLEIHLGPGTHRIQGRNLKTNNPYSVPVHDSWWECEPLTLEVPQGSGHLMIQIQKDPQALRPQVFRFRQAQTQEPQKASWHGFLGAGASYPFFAEFVDGNLEGGFLYWAPDPQVLTGTGLQIRILASAYNRGLWAGVRGHGDFLQVLSFGAGIYYQIRDPEIPYGEWYSQKFAPPWFPEIFIGGSIPLSGQSTGWQITWNLGFNFIYWVYYPREPYYTLENPNTFVPLRPELGLRYVFP